MPSPFPLSARTSFEARSPDQRARLTEATRQFEAIFVRQMLASARSAQFDDGGLFTGEGEETFTEMRDAQFADITAASGALGLAQRLEQELGKFVGKDA